MFQLMFYFSIFITFLFFIAWGFTFKLLSFIELFFFSQNKIEICSLSSKLLCILPKQHSLKRMSLIKHAFSAILLKCVFWYVNFLVYKTSFLSLPFSSFFLSLFFDSFIMYKLTFHPFHPYHPASSLAFY